MKTGSIYTLQIGTNSGKRATLRNYPYIISHYSKRPYTIMNYFDYFKIAEVPKHLTLDFVPILLLGNPLCL